jgi:hypothetical protein
MTTHPADTVAMQLTDEQVWKLAEIILTNDGGCTVCVPSLYIAMVRLFPDDAARIREAVLARCGEHFFDPAHFDGNGEA